MQSKPIPKHKTHLASHQGAHSAFSKWVPFKSLGLVDVDHDVNAPPYRIYKLRAIPAASFIN
jgi:hypothetical protein